MVSLFSTCSETPMMHHPLPSAVASLVAVDWSLAVAEKIGTACRPRSLQAVSKPALVLDTWDERMKDPWLA